MEISIKFKEKEYSSRLDIDNLQETINKLFEDCENIEQHQLCEKLCSTLQNIKNLK